MGCVLASQELRKFTEIVFPPETSETIRSEPLCAAPVLEVGWVTVLAGRAGNLNPLELFGGKKAVAGVELE